MEIKRELMDKYGLIGKDIGYSFSPRYFKAKFKNEELNASYENLDCYDIQEVAAQLQQVSFSGYNVTIPYKEAILPLLDHLDPHAKAIGAVNTIKRLEDGTLKGFNTDFIGFGNSLLEWYGATIFYGKEQFSAFAKTGIPSEILSDQETIGKTTTEAVPLPKEPSLSNSNPENNASATHPSAKVTALILGTGGASKAVVYALEQLGVECRYVSRKRTKEKLTYTDLKKGLMDQVTLIVNCTPLGTYPEVQLHPDIPYCYLDRSHIVYDLIYNPPETVLLSKAAQQKSSTHNGLRMLELQAEASWEIWNPTS